MSIKFENRFSPSILKAAECAENANAAMNVPVGDKLHEKAQDIYRTTIADFARFCAGVGLPLSEASSQINEAIALKREERIVASKRRKAIREQHAADREQYTFA